MDDQPKNPNEFLKNHEPFKKPSLKIKLKSSKSINGCCKEESQSSELKSCKRKLKDHLQSPSIERGNRKFTHPASDESVNGGSLKINSEKTTCLVCGKIFPSDKSLYGHMRLHPEREWRGIKPPASWSPKNIFSLTVSVSTMGNIDDQQQNSPSTSERSDLDLLQSLKGWSKTGLRGWSGIELEAADGLRMLVNGHSLDLVGKNKVTDRVTEGKLMAAELKNSVQILESSEFHCKKHKVHQEYENIRNVFNPELVEMGPGWQFSNGFEEFSGNNSTVDQPNGTYSLYSIARNFIPVESQIHMEKFSEWGHKNGNPNAGSGGWSIADDSQGFITAKNIEIHQCKFCSKIFPTGQALGGHQRSHRTAPPRAPISTISTPEVINMESPISSTVSQSDIVNKDSPISSVTLLEGGASGMVDRKFMELDLNEPPPYDECLIRVN